MIHIALDVGGMVPAVGIACDLVNGVIYTIEGDGVNASFSYAGAIPIVGWFSTGAKYTFKGVKLANGSKTTLKWIVKVNKFIDFGDRNQLRKILNIATGNSKRAHHIIP